MAQIFSAAKLGTEAKSDNASVECAKIVRYGR
ncbi:hypothetical protein M892_21360 [Vibrio campbellii ATCC BAA-1116]|nr:hypothetical protein M892_21360 [Vibrio campbellii ATCC BAA-1116]